MGWTRPDTIPYPTVWRRFEGKVLIDGKPLKYRVQDVTPELAEPVIETMCRYYLAREACFSHDGLLEDDVSLNELKTQWRSFILDQKLGLVVIVEGEGDEKKRIAGCNILCVKQKSDIRLQPKGKALQHALQKWDELYGKANLFEKHGVDLYAAALGLTVAPQYQGDNIAYHILMSRVPLLQACNIELAGTSFTNPAVIHQAIKAGYEFIKDVKSQDFVIDGKVHYPRLRSTPITLAIMKIPKRES